MPGLPGGGYNLPPGCTLADVEGDSDSDSDEDEEDASVYETGEDCDRRED